ncbi:MAG: hypothetical protein E7774_09870 [Bradyrhizobium sp.]|nr:MAG: hypothetical protein E7774_09870 [Bradyrhizobium sp.]
MKSELPILHFDGAPAFAAWLAANPDSKGAWIKLAKQGAPEPALRQAQAVDCALCHGWIDGQIGRFDEEFFLTRFTPRAAKSRWSAANRKRAEELIAAGRVRKSGLAAIEAAKADGRWEAAYPSASKAVTPEDFQIAIAANRRAAKAFEDLDGANRYALLYRLHHVAAAKRAEMIARFVAMLARGETIHPPRQARKAKSGAKPG